MLCLIITDQLADGRLVIIDHLPEYEHQRHAPTLDGVRIDLMLSAPELRPLIEMLDPTGG